MAQKQKNDAHEKWEPLSLKRSSTKNVSLGRNHPFLVEMNTDQQDFQKKNESYERMNEESVAGSFSGKKIERKELEHLRIQLQYKKYKEPSNFTPGEERFLTYLKHLSNRFIEEKQQTELDEARRLRESIDEIRELVGID